MNRRRRVLVLDADERLLIELERLLEDDGFDTTITWECRQAVEILGSQELDLVVIGDHPPEISATDILALVHHGPAPVRCVVLHPADRTSLEYLGSLGAFAVAGRRGPEDILRVVKEQLGTKANPAAA